MTDSPLSAPSRPLEAPATPTPARARPITPNTLGHKLGRLLLFVGVPLVLGLAVMLWATVQLGEVSARRERERVYFNALGALELCLVNVETGVRGYALSGEKTYLEPYTRGRSDLLAALESFKNNTPQQAAEIGTLPEQARAFLRTWADVGAADVSGFGYAEQRDFIAQGKRLLDPIRAEIDTAQARLGERLSTIRSDQFALVRLLEALALVLLLLGLLALYLLRRGLAQLVVRPLGQLTGAVRSLEQGDLSTRVRFTSDDELGLLAHTFNQTASALERQNAELERSNRELEQFAYVASHDLQEPLRMVSSYTQLLQKRYQGKLDARADQYIGFATDGAHRMQRLIQDLLAFSRVGTQQGALVPLESSEIVQEVLASLEVALRESGAEVRLYPLPRVCGDRRQLGQVFQNLISNAIKFRREGVAPVVEIAATRADEFWEFSVKDNGIGIEQDYFERIFVIFQRLHTKEQFEGSGIGLAIVKKIVERHGGRMWLESTPGVGSTFHFTLRAADGRSVGGRAADGAA